MQSKDKETRAAALQVALRREQVSIRRGASWSAALVDELLSFPLALGAGVDDQVDALGLVARSVTRLGGRLPDAPRLRVYNLLDPHNPNAPPRTVTLREPAPMTASPR